MIEIEEGRRGSRDAGTGDRLLVTHTDRDGVLSGAALLHVLGARDDAAIVLTQGVFLAEELEELADDGRTFGRIAICDTYWHPPAADRVVAALLRLLRPGGTVLWLDHHPSTVEDEAGIRARLPLDARSFIEGDRAGRHESVSLVAEAFAAADDPVVADLAAAARGGPTVVDAAQVTAWLHVIDGLPREPDLPAGVAAGLVRALSDGFGTPVPDALAPLAATTVRILRRTDELATNDWPLLPSVDGGYGMYLDLSGEPLANAYVLGSTLFRMAEGRLDYFVIAESPEVAHYVSGARARARRDELERGTLPRLSASTRYKGRRGAVPRRQRWQMGIDLKFLTRRHPAPGVVAEWIDAHPYIVKAVWRDGATVDAAVLRSVADDVGAAMVQVLETYGWCDRDRIPRRWFRQGAVG